MLITNPTAVKVMVAVALIALAFAVVAQFGAAATEAWRKVRCKPIAVFFLLVATIYGGSKPSFRYDGGIKASAAQQSYATNDTVAVYWERDPRAIIPLPDDAPVFIDYRPIDSTEEWGMLAQSTVGAGGWTGELHNATNYDFNVYAYYIPPEPVHTNGVWQYRTITDPERKRGIIPLRATIKDETHTIYPPKEN